MQLVLCSVQKAKDPLQFQEVNSDPPTLPVVPIELVSKLSRIELQSTGPVAFPAVVAPQAAGALAITWLESQ